MNVHLKKKRIIIASPDPKLVNDIQKVVRPQGAIVFPASTPEQTVFDAGSRHADLLILDERMPSLHGKNLLVAIRMAAPNIALMIVSEHQHGSCTIDASARGADAIISRNSDENQILNAVCHAMGIPCDRLPGVGPFHGRTMEEVA